MGYTYEVICQAIQFGVILNNIFHVWDGDELQDPEDVADVFEDHFIDDLKAFQVDNVTWESITVTPLDVGNPFDPLVRVINVPGTDVNDALPTGTHIWVKLKSDDNGFKAGGKMIFGLSENENTDGVVPALRLANYQNVFDILINQLVLAGLALCIYRPSLSTPGFPQISISSAAIARGIASNNRRQRAFQA